MSTITGTASGYIDLLSILDNFLTATGHCWGLSFTGTGSGRLRNYIGTASSVAETITCTATSSTSFTVSGSISGSLGTATVGTQYSGTKCAFLIQAGAVAFVSGDQFRFNTSPRWTRRRLAGCSEAALRTASWGETQSLFDGSVSTGYTARTLPCWVRMECDFPTVVKSFSVGTLTTAANAPRDFDLQWSDDGTNWTTLMAVTNQTSWATNSIRLFVPTSPPSKRFWRVYFTASNATTLDLNEVQFFGGVSGQTSWRVDQRVQYGWDAPGVDGGQTIYVPGHTYSSAGEDVWNLCFRGFRYITGIEPDPSFYDGVTPATGTVAMCLRKVNIAYWIVAHGSRAIVITRHTGLYQFAYLGLGLPYETPTEHPYPYIIAAPSNTQSRKFDSGAGSYRNPADPGQNTLWVMMPDGEFASVGNRSDLSTNEGQQAGSNVTWPYSTNTIGAQLGNLRNNLDGSLPILPVIIRIDSPRSHMWGELDGVYWTTGFGNSVEALTKVGQIDYLSVPNVMRTSINNWCMVALD